MWLQGSRFRSLFARVLVGLVAIGLASGGAAPVRADPLQPPDFQLRFFLAPPATGIVVRGDTSQNPVYGVESLTGGCEFFTNSISVESLFGFTGTINLEILNLPAGVTSQTATSLTITGPTPNAASSPTTAFILSAASNAALGDATVTLRATSGSIVHTVDLPISVVDPPPPCVPQQSGTQPLRPDSVTIDRAEFSNQRLRVEATECCRLGSMAWVTVASTGEVIGALTDEGKVGNFATKFKGEFTLSVNPQQIKVIASPLGGWQQADVTAK